MPITLRVFQSVAKTFNGLVDDAHRGAKGTAFNAALFNVHLR